MASRQKASIYYIPWAEFLEIVAMIKRADQAAGVVWWEDEETLSLKRAREAERESREYMEEID